MAAGEEAEEDHHSGDGLSDNGVDVVSDHGDEDKCPQDLGSVRYLGYF